MFEAKKIFQGAAYGPLGAMESNQIARAVDQDPEQLIEHLNELQGGPMSANERTLATIIRGILISMSRVKEP